MGSPPRRGGSPGISGVHTLCGQLWEGGVLPPHCGGAPPRAGGASSSPLAPFENPHLSRITHIGHCSSGRCPVTSGLLLGREGRTSQLWRLWNQPGQGTSPHTPLSLTFLAPETRFCHLPHAPSRKCKSSKLLMAAMSFLPSSKDCFWLSLSRALLRGGGSVKVFSSHIGSHSACPRESETPPC